MPRVWQVTTPDHERLVWAETYWNRTMKRFPIVTKDGFVWLDGFPYVHDAQRDDRETYHEKKWPFVIVLAGLIFGGISFAIAPLYVGTAIIGASWIVAFFIGSPLREDVIANWRQNEPDQINMTDESLTPGSIGITGDTIATYSKSQHLKRLVSEGPNWYAIIAILCVILSIGLMIALYYKK